MLLCRRMMKGAAAGLALLVLAVAAFRAGQYMSNALGAGPRPVYAEDEAASTTQPVQVEYREATIEGQAVGEVLIDGQVVARICTGAAGFASGERAMVVAKRLRDWTLSGANPDELTAMEGADDGAVVIAGDRIIVTITGEDGAASDATPMELAWMWRNNIAAALGGEPVLAEQEEVTEEVVAAEWVAEEPYKDKIVPIVSVLEGVRIGAARVNGPESKVDLVQAVGQLETHFRDVLEIDIYVPITTEKPGQTLHRVQGVGVTALGDYRL